MLAKGYHLGGSTWREIPRNTSPAVSNILRKRGFDELNNQYGINPASLYTDWRYDPEMVFIRDQIKTKIFEITSSVFQNEQLAPMLELLLFTTAASKEEYMNLETLNQHLQSLMDASKNYPMPEGGLSDRSIVHDLPCFPDDGSSIPQLADMDMLYNLPVSGGGSNLVSNTRSISNYFPQQQTNNLEMDLKKYSDCLGTVQNNDSISFPTTMGISLQSADLNFKFPQPASVNISEFSNQFPGLRSFVDLDDTMQYQSQKLHFQKNSTVRHDVNDVPSGNTEPIQRPAKRHKMMDSGFGLSSINYPSFDQWNWEMFQPHSSQTEVQQQSEFPLSSIHYEGNGEQFTNPMFHSTGIRGINNNVMAGTFEQILEEPGLESRDVMDSNSLKEIVVNLKSRMHTLDMVPIPTDGEDIQETTAFWTNAKKKVDELIDDQEKITNSSITTVSEKRNYMIYDISGQNCETGISHSKGLEAGQMSDEQDSISYGMIDNKNSVEVYHMPTPSSELIIIDDVDDEEDIQGRTGFNQEGINANKEFIETKDDHEKHTESSNTNVAVDTLGKTFKTETFPSKGLEASQISEEKDLESHGVIHRSKSMEIGNGSNSNMHALICKVPIPIDVEDKQDIIGFNQKGTDAKVGPVSLIDLFTPEQIKEHISSLTKKPFKVGTEEERGIDANICQLCEEKKLYFAPVPIVCLRCGKTIRKNTTYFCRKEEEFDAQRCICSGCYRTSKGGHIKFNGISISKAHLEKKNNDELLEEAWVECNKCKRWQHQVCALYNNKRDLDREAEYICPFCRLKEFENGIHNIPLPKSAIFGAKDLPTTMLSDHLEKRLFESLMQERADWNNDKGKENPDKVLAEESLSIREVLSVDKELKVKKQFLDIIPEENYPAEFSYKSRVILLFQHIEGADVCIFAMYVQEFGSDCANPNQRCVYISYLDSVKYFRPERNAAGGGALRTFVYHEILIGYLDFCKKRGFSTCYIWACAPSKKEDDYILYCHPGEQKTPPNDKLRRWYLSMLKRATEENIVVGLTNLYDHFFLPTEESDSKLSASRLPYFDGDYWCGYAMGAATEIEKESGGDYEKMLKKQVPNRALKTMGHDNPSRDTAKDILVMQRLGQHIIGTRGNFLIAHLQYSCMHCREVIISGKRWFCTKCKKFQECERCHSSDVHTSKNGEVHTLCQVVVNDIPSNTKNNDDIILESGLFENRNTFLSFCQKYLFQFDTLRRAKYSSMMILYYLNNPTLVTVGTCSICCAYNVFQECWKCEICPECTICSACYKDRGADCHVHKLTHNDQKLTQNEHKLAQNEHKLAQNYSTPLCQSGNQELNETLMVKLLDVLKHASQCHATKAEPCSYPNCSQIKKLFSHASKCEIRVNQGCQLCKKTWFILTAHSRNCEDSECRIPRCRDLKKHEEMRTMHSAS
ncbi:histone acetyltransferase HAC1-like [Trifolium pratense]|uniref:histone acetyltransferase HAC1-like n=1 Tax=Trifolium pratense TaxID=57577 RepID=UPI001E69178D|nr:histone acetyltransferase HAC1-like [Trifolium pratense]XP_045818201.1 histone acetyltransferase HAC1-like [Trifolium pratense]